MDTRRFSRRHALGAAGAGAVALGSAAVSGGGVPAAVARRVAGALEGGLRPELISVTQRGFAAWWVSDAPADTVVRYARADGRGGVRQARLGRRRTVHAAEIDGLRPDTRYRYELRSGGRRVPRSGANPGSFRTLPRLEGNRLATIAVLNDIHVGEECSGTIENVDGDSVPPCFATEDYAYRMTRGAIAEIRALEPDLVVANGDLTDRGKPADIDRALALLRRAGAPLLITRGNHDRRLHDGGCGEDGDCLRRAAFPERAPGDHALTSLARVGDRVAVLGLDSCDPETGEGRLDLGGQVAWLDARLAELRAEGRVPLVCFHHHVAVQATTTHPPPLFSGISALRGGLDALRVIGRHDVPLVLHGHTHRNYLARDALAPRSWFLENGAAKEYPAGYAVLGVHEDGIVRTFHRPTGAFSREWTRTSAQQIYGRQPDYTRGTLASRAFTLRFGGATGPGTPAPSLIGPLGPPGPRRGLLEDTVRDLRRGALR